MYSLSGEWIQKINQSRTATLDANGKITKSITPIEPDAQFFNRTIGVLISSQSANPNWYAAGEMFQAFLVGFGSAGFAQGESIRTTLNRYRVYKFNQFPFIQGETKYLLSFSPKAYFKDVRLQVWEYQGANQGVSEEDLERSILSVRQQTLKVAAQASAIRDIVNKINQKL